MGDDAIDAMLYMQSRDSEKLQPIGRMTEIPKLAPGGFITEGEILECLGKGKQEKEIVISLKTITKKRFIKSLMGMRYQRNQAYKMHNEYMKSNRCRTFMGMIFFVTFYNQDFKVNLTIGDGEVEGQLIETNKM